LSRDQLFAQSSDSHELQSRTMLTPPDAHRRQRSHDANDIYSGLESTSSFRPSFTIPALLSNDSQAETLYSRRLAAARQLTPVRDAIVYERARATLPDAHTVAFGEHARFGRLFRRGTSHRLWTRMSVQSTMRRSPTIR